MFRLAVALPGLIVGLSGCSKSEPAKAPEEKPVSANASADTDGMDEHLVRVHIPLKAAMPTTEEFDRFVALEDELDEAVQEAGVGALDGHEMGGNEYTIWLYGADGGKLAEVVKKALEKESLPPGSTLFVRHGGVEDESAMEQTIPLGKIMMRHR